MGGAGREGRRKDHSISHSLTHIHTHTHTHIHTHPHIPTHIHIYTYTHTPSAFPLEPAGTVLTGKAFQKGSSHSSASSRQESCLRLHGQRACNTAVCL